MKKLVLATALLLPFASGISFASLVNVDGDLQDLSDAIANDYWSQPYNNITLLDAQDGDANGFDIKNTYAHYDVASDTFFLGMSMYGTIYESGGNEGSLAYFGSSSTTFDIQEQYGFNMTIGSDPSKVVELVLSGNGSGGIYAGINTKPAGVTVGYAISVADEGIEFSIQGLDALGLLGNFSLANPTDAYFTFTAGTAMDFAGEDFATVNMQVVPVPAAVWLFISGVAGLAAIGKKRRYS